MDTSSAIKIKIDNKAKAAYIYLLKGKIENGKVAVTHEIVDDAVLVDVNSNEQVLGIELLDLNAAIPYDRIIRNANGFTQELADKIEVLRAKNGIPAAFQLDARAAVAA